MRHRHDAECEFLTSAATNRADALKMVAQSRYANINTILDDVENQPLFDNHAVALLLQAAVAPAPEDFESMATNP